MIVTLLTPHPFMIIMIALLHGSSNDFGSLTPSNWLPNTKINIHTKVAFKFKVKTTGFEEGIKAHNLIMRIWFSPMSWTCTISAAAFLAGSQGL
jgi:hypothetical protein